MFGKRRAAATDRERGRGRACASGQLPRGGGPVLGVLPCAHCQAGILVPFRDWIPDRERRDPPPEGCSGSRLDLLTTPSQCSRERDTSGDLWLSSPVTDAGQRRIHTGLSLADRATIVEFPGLRRKRALQGIGWCGMSRVPHLPSTRWHPPTTRSRPNSWAELPRWGSTSSAS